MEKNRHIVSWFAKGFLAVYTVATNNENDFKHMSETKGEKMYSDIKVETLPQSQVKISGEITEKAFEKARKTALEQFKLAVEIPGFRVGKAPEALVVKHVGEMKILERAAANSIEDAYGLILDEFKVRAIGQPAVTITKIAANNPLGFVLETAVMPEVSIENYEKIAQEAVAKIPDAPETAEEKEIDEVIEDLRKRVAIETASVAPVDKNAADVNANPGDEKAAAEPVLPEVNNEFVKKFGNFENVADFREKAKANLIERKKRDVREKRRGAIAEQLIAEAKFDVPEIFIESELETMIGQFKADIARNGLTFDGYLASIKKTEADIKKEWRESAERRARLELILKYIAQTEKITPDEAEVKKEVDHVISHHKGADRFSIRMYIENMMKNKLVLDFLEKGSEKSKK